MAADADIAFPYRGLDLQEDPRLLCKEPLPLMEEGLSPVVRLNDDARWAQISAIWEAIGLYFTAAPWTHQTPFFSWDNTTRHHAGILGNVT